MSVHLNLRNKRKELELTQEEVADRLGISRQAISKWENGNGYPDIDNLILLSKLYGVSVDDLLQGDAAKEKKVKRRVPGLLLCAFLAAILPPIGGVAAVAILKKARGVSVAHKKTIVFLCKISIILSIVVVMIGVNFVLYWQK